MGSHHNSSSQSVWVPFLVLIQDYISTKAFSKSQKIKKITFTFMYLTDITLSLLTMLCLRRICIPFLLYAWLLATHVVIMHGN